MRSAKTGCIVLALILGLCIVNVMYLKNIESKITTDLTYAKNYAADEEWDKAQTSSKKALDEWESHGVFLGTSLRHVELDEISLKLHVIHQQAIQKNEDDFIITCREAIELLNIMMQTEIPSLKNIM